VKILVAIPFRGDGGWRDAAFDAAYANAKASGYPVAVGDSGDQPFSLARTWNQLASENSWDVLVKWTADLILKDTTSIRAAAKHDWARAYDRSVQFTSATSQAYYRRGRWPNRISQETHGDGVMTVTREAWEKVGGFDHNFVGYGFEDWAWFHGMKLYFGEAKTIPGTLGVLWHPAHRGAKAEHGPDDYWRARTDNYARWKKVQKIRSKSQWQRYVATR
jgi:N-terminal domain of galactosyltransferase